VKLCQFVQDVRNKDGATNVCSVEYSTVKNMKRNSIHDGLEKIVEKRFKDTDRYAWVLRNVQFEFRRAGRKVSGDIDVLARRWSGDYVVVEVKSNDRQGHRNHMYYQLDKADWYVRQKYPDAEVVHGVYVAYKGKRRDIRAMRVYRREKS